MSALPERRKSAEELAELRESLGISKDGPPTGAPGVAKTSLPEPEPSDKQDAEDLKSSVFDAPAEDPKKEQKAMPKLKQVRSLRRSERVPLDQARKVSDSGKLPVRRHTENELRQLKCVEPVAAEAPAVHLQKMTAGLVSLFVIYGGGVLLIVVSGLGASTRGVLPMDLPWSWLADLAKLPNYSMILYGLLLGGVAVLLLGALWIYFLKTLSRHHAGFMTIIAVLVLVFGTLYFFPQLHGA